MRLSGCRGAGRVARQAFDAGFPLHVAGAPAFWSPALVACTGRWLWALALGAMKIRAATKRAFDWARFRLGALSIGRFSG